MQKRDKYNHVDITGKHFGRLTAISKVGRSKWLLKCNCGNEIILNQSRLLCGQKSCGCLKRECGIDLGERRKIHGESRTKLYRKYRGILDRCYNENSPHYKRYGQRGIDVCDEWRQSFESFKKWAYENGYDPDINGRMWSIDRIDNSKGYYPWNCRFTTAHEQMRNRDITTLYEYRGNTYTASEFADKYGIEKSFVYKHIKQKNQTLEEVLHDWNKTHDIPEGMMDVSNYAKLHEVSITTVNRWIHSGKIKAEKRGIKWYVYAQRRKDKS